MGTFPPIEVLGVTRCRWAGGLNVLQAENDSYYIAPVGRSSRHEEMSEIDMALYLQ